MTTTRTYDYLNRLVSISSRTNSSGTAPLSHTYAYDDANQRTRVNHADGSYWLYEYDRLGQVVSGKRFWSDGTPVAGQQSEYAFDDIGNRTMTKAGGDANGLGLRSATYGANSLNRYTNRTVPGAVDILGIAHAQGTVTVNGQSTYRKGEYYWKKLALNNSSVPVYASVTNLAVLTGQTNTTIGNVYLPKTPESFTYDADGNLTSDGRWTNHWDGENRLIQMESVAAVPTAAKRKLVFRYDHQGRRLSKVVWPLFRIGVVPEELFAVQWEMDFINVNARAWPRFWTLKSGS